MTMRETSDALHRFGLARDRLSSALCRSSGLTATELQALEQLEADGPLTQRMLGDRLALTSGGTTILVDRLERVGYVRRRPHPGDRRAVLVELTPDAAESAPPALARYHDAVTAAARRLTAAEREAATLFLRETAAAAAECADALRGPAGGRLSRLAR